ncbi:hypothetical protein EDC01DRAFT_730680 [Geopyxis carbonaria]|nr:hypothetical protein EDC01DRAFT_730680 [Geopyxis carbonaria]
MGMTNFEAILKFLCHFELVRKEILLNRIASYAPIMQHCENATEPDRSLLRERFNNSIRGNNESFKDFIVRLRAMAHPLKSTAQEVCNLSWKNKLLDGSLGPDWNTLILRTINIGLTDPEEILKNLCDAELARKAILLNRIASYDPTQYSYEDATESDRSYLRKRFNHSIRGENESITAFIDRLRAMTHPLKSTAEEVCSFSWKNKILHGSLGPEWDFVVLLIVMIGITNFEAIVIFLCHFELARKANLLKRMGTHASMPPSASNTQDVHQIKAHENTNCRQQCAAPNKTLNANGKRARNGLDGLCDYCGGLDYCSCSDRKKKLGSRSTRLPGRQDPMPRPVTR